MKTTEEVLKAAPVERRQFGRRQVCKPAVVIGADGWRWPCTVINISQTGVGLKSPEVDSMPDQFGLLIETDDWLVACQMVHRTGNTAGAKFLSAPRKASRVNSPTARRARMVLAYLLKGEPPRGE